MKQNNPSVIADSISAPTRKSSLIYAGWGAVLLAFLLQLCATGPVFYAFGSFASVFVKEFGASRSETGMAYSLLLMVGGLGAAPAGWVLDRWPLRPILLIGALLTALGMASLAYATSITQVIILFATAIGVGDVLMGLVPSNYLVSQWFERRRGLALGIAVLGTSAATIVFPPLTVYLLKSVGWQSMFLYFGGLIAALVVPIAIFGRVPRRLETSERLSPDFEASSDEARMTVWEIIRVPAFWVVSIAVGAMIGITGGVTISIVPHAVARGFESMQAATLVSIVGGGAIVGKLSFGAISDRVDLRWALRSALLTMGMSNVLLVPSWGYGALVVASFLFGASLGGMLPVWAAIVGRVFGRANVGSALGLTRAAMVPFSVVCPLIAGASFDRTGSYNAAWIAFAVMLAAGIAVTFCRGNWAARVTPSNKS